METLLGSPLASLASELCPNPAALKYVEKSFCDFIQENPNLTEPISQGGLKLCLLFCLCFAHGNGDANSTSGSIDHLIRNLSNFSLEIEEFGMKNEKIAYKNSTGQIIQFTNCPFIYSLILNFATQKLAPVHSHIPEAIIRDTLSLVFVNLEI